MSSAEILSELNAKNIVRLPLSLLTVNIYIFTRRPLSQAMGMSLHSFPRPAGLACWEVSQTLSDSPCLGSPLSRAPRVCCTPQGYKLCVVIATDAIKTTPYNTANFRSIFFICNIIPSCFSHNSSRSAA